MRNRYEVRHPCRPCAGPSHGALRGSLTGNRCGVRHRLIPAGEDVYERTCSAWGWLAPAEAEDPDGSARAMCRAPTMAPLCFFKAGERRESCVELP